MWVDGVGVKLVRKFCIGHKGSILGHTATFLAQKGSEVRLAVDDHPVRQVAQQVGLLAV